MRHASRLNGAIDWEAYELGYFGHRIIEELSSNSDNNNRDSSDSNDDSDCVFIYSTSGNTRTGENIVYSPPIGVHRKEISFLCS